MKAVLASAKRYAIAQMWWQEVTFVCTKRNVASQNRPGLPSFKSEAAINSLGRPGDEANVHVHKYDGLMLIAHVF